MSILPVERMLPAQLAHSTEAVCGGSRPIATTHLFLSGISSLRSRSFVLISRMPWAQCNQRDNNHSAMWLTVLLCFLGSATALFAGKIEGQVSYRPLEKTRAVMLSPYARNAYQDRSSAKAIRGSTEGIVVYLSSHPNLDSRTSTNPVPVVDQKNITIVPHVTPVVIGTTVDFRNSDRVYHNIFSLSRAKSFNLGRYGTGQTRSINFNKTGVVEVFCDIHADMNGVVLVVPNTYYTLLAPDGSYSISDVPSGTYTLTVWREKSARKTEQITIDNENTILIINFDL